MGNWGLSQMEGRGAHWFKKVNGVLGSGFVNTEKEEVVCFLKVQQIPNESTACWDLGAVTCCQSLNRPFE